MNSIDNEFSSIANIGKRYSNRGVTDTQERQRLEKASEDLEALQEGVENTPSLAASATIQNGIKIHSDTINRLGPRVNSRRELRRERAIRETESLVRRQFSSSHMNGQIRDSSQNADTQARALGMMGMSQRDLESERTKVFSQIGELEQNTLNETQNNLYDREGRQDPEVLQKIKGSYRSKQALSGRAATIETALKKQRQAGMDDASKDRDRFSLVGNAQDIEFKNNVSQELRSGQGLGALNITQLKQQEAQAAKALIEAMEKLTNSAGEGSEKIDELRTNADKAGDELKKTQEAIKQVGSAGGGGANTAVNYANGIGHIANAARTVLIDQQMQSMSNRTGFANLANREFGIRDSAIRGDMRSLLTATGGVGSTMNSYADNLKTNQDIVSGLKVTESGIHAGLAVAEGVSAAKNNFNPVAQGTGTARIDELSKAVERGSAAAGALAINAGDVISGASRRSIELNARNQVLDQAEAVNNIPGEFKQKFFDYSMASRSAINAAGGSVGQRMMNEYAGDKGDAGGLLGRMQAARIAPEEFARMSAMGASQQGSMFNSSAVFSARNMERSGNGSIESNMQRMSQLANAGSNNPQAAFASVLEAAFSKSLDSSKALNMMVENTAEMVKSSGGTAALGIDTSSQSASRLSAFVNENNPNKEAAIARAMEMQGKLGQETMGVSSSFTDMLGTTKVAGAAGVDFVTATAMRNTAPNERRALTDKADSYKGMSKEDQAKFRDTLRQKGMGGLINDDMSINSKGLSAGFDAADKSILMGGAGLALGSGDENYQKYVAGKLSLEEMKKDEKKYGKTLNTIGRVSAFTQRDYGSGQGATMEELDAQAFGAQGVNEKGKAKAANALSGKNSATGAALDNAATAGAAEDANRARLAAQGGGGAASAMAGIAKQMEGLVKSLNDKTSQDFQQAAVKGAAEFKDGADVFLKATDKFTESVKIFESIPRNFSADLAKELAGALKQGGKAMNSLPSAPKDKFGPKY